MSMDQQSPQPETLWTEANALVGQGNLLDAIPLYLQLSDLWPDRAAVWLNLGIVLGALHRHGEAAQCLQRALEMEPDSPMAHYQLGQMQEHLGALDEAARSYLMAAELDPGYLDAWNSLADIALQCEEFDLARQYLEPVLAIEPEDAPGNFLMGNLLQQQGDDEGAAQHFAVAYKFANDPACGNNLASALAQLGRTEEAVDLLHRLLQMHPDFKLAWNTLGGLLMQEKNFSAARDALERAIAIDEDFHPARHGLARCLVQIRDLSHQV
ncbi:MAG: tetratricopeptide repeat protein [Alphaproteobacteria bacterium]|jgi:tetratricopeptide (TPR) repeat protein|nr:tetratricopeptide repeat protein [Alphaproteobacteria bacterium]MDP6829804.1 tetratricopeptide repeat protein [Alphaproteobacteria bacterium]